MKNHTVHTVEDVRQDVNAFLTSYFKQKSTDATQLDKDYGFLWRSLHELHKAGGKRLRPYLFVTTYETLGGSTYERILPIAASLELLHLAMLIHDDIIDRDYVRHGADNLAGIYHRKYSSQTTGNQEADHYAASAAILGGDLMLSEAYQLILNSKITDSQKVAAMKLMGNAVYTVVGGELLDTEAVLHEPDYVDSLKIAKLKTAHYSCTTPLLMAALMAGSDSSIDGVLKELGNALGIAVQLANDEREIFSGTKQTGKSAIGDIREGKRTYLLQRTLKLANAKQRNELEKIIGNPKCDETMAETVRQIMEACGAREEVNQTIKHYNEKAKILAAKLPIDKTAQSQFAEFIEKL